MKTFHFLLIGIIMILIGCKKEAVIEDEYTMLKNANIPISIELEFGSFPDPTAAPVLCTPENFNFSLSGKDWLKGHVSKIGKVDEAKSYAINTGCSFVDESHIREVIKGIITSKGKGDHFNYTGWIEVDFSDVATSMTATFTGEIDANGGSERFDGVVGKIFITGTTSFNTGETKWKGTGELSYNHDPCEEEK